MDEKPYLVKTPQDYLNMLKRRKIWLLLPLVSIFSLAVIIALVIPPVYRSEAIILIEEQAVPKDFVQSTITSYADQRVQVISRRVLTTENITRIIKKFNLYQQDESGAKNSPEAQSDTATKLPKRVLAQKFRDNVGLDLVSAEVIDPRSGRSTNATIAFTLSFENPQPETAQKIADELVTLFLSENRRERTEQVASTAEFLATEAERLNAELLELENRLAAFKSANEGSLPQLYQYNLSALERMEREGSDLETRIQELVKRRIEISSQMSQVSRSAPVVLATGDVVMSDADRLKALQSEYRHKASIYQDNHPDIIRLEREIKVLQDQLGVGTDTQDLQRQLEEQKQYLAELLTRYNENHQEVQSTKRLIAQLEESVRAARLSNSGGQEVAADNPAYVLLQTQLDTTNSEINTLSARLSDLKAQIDHYQGLIKQAPQVEMEYQALLRDYDNATVEYREIKAKQRDAMVAKNLEQEQKGERFALIEPPAYPMRPIKPNRPAIIFIGFVVALGAGVGAAALREFTDAAVHGVSELTAILGQEPLVSIPYIDNDIDISRRQRFYLYSMLAMAGVIALVVYVDIVFSH
ncbi:Wzz/FepE/Etk N-terminal domain-containing protein [Haliea sp. E17]|uniref:Wzz/FepE/Etk N-terminal domain-containing protein n=1 Tax=Haliea sp. E17 TaxID=3401576 RepID=UPI003AB07491